MRKATLLGVHTAGSRRVLGGFSARSRQILGKISGKSRRNCASAGDELRRPPKTAPREPKGSQRMPKGAEKEPKGSQREPTGRPKGTRGAPKTIKKRSCIGKTFWKAKGELPHFRCSFFGFILNPFWLPQSVIVRALFFLWVLIAF